MYASGDGDEGCPRVHTGKAATVAARGSSRAQQAWRRRMGKQEALMVGWLDPQTAPGSLISEPPPRPAPSLPPSGEALRTYTPQRGKAGEPLLGEGVM